jgi:hypothetical protein
MDILVYLTVGLGMIWLAAVIICETYFNARKRFLIALTNDIESMIFLKKKDKENQS